MPVILRELVNATGYTAATVSQVLNSRSHSGSDETKQQIFAIETGCRRNLVGRSPCIYTIGQIVENIASPISSIVLHGIQDYLQQFNYFSLSSAVFRLSSENAFANLRA